MGLGVPLGLRGTPRLVLGNALNPAFSRFTRRSFLNRLALSTAAAASGSTLLRSAPSLTASGCRFQTHELSSPSLQKFFAAIEPGSDPFLCERYAADLDVIF